MTEQQYRIIADRDKGDDPKYADAQPGDRITLIRGDTSTYESADPVRIERPVPTPTAEQYTPEDGPAPWGYLDTDRIADMVPGTTFRGMEGGVLDAFAMRVDSPLGDVVMTDGSFWPASQFDPSTIRDVTPPTN